MHTKSHNSKPEASKHEHVQVSIGPGQVAHVSTAEAPREALGRWGFSVLGFWVYGFRGLGFRV